MSARLKSIGVTSVKFESTGVTSVKVVATSKPYPSHRDILSPTALCEWIRAI